MFQVETSHADRMIVVRMSGVLSIEEAHACAAAKEAAVESMGSLARGHCTMVDIRELRLHPQEVFAIFTHFVATTKRKSRKIAIVAGEGTARMQFRRVAESAPLRGDMRFFPTAAAARDWLRDDAMEVSQPALRPASPRLPLAG
jgi:hypothetical protein